MLVIRGRNKPLDPTPVLVVAVCLATQLAYQIEGRRDPTFRTPIIDAGVYHEAATRFARGEPLVHDAFWQPPLFPALLGCLYRLTGPSVWAAKVALALLAALSCLALWWIGTRIFSRRVGVAAGIILAVYGPFVFFSTRLLPTGLAVFLDLAALVLTIRCLEKPSWHRWLLCGAGAGAATITVPNAAVLLAVAAFGLFCSASPRWRRRRVASGGASLFLGFSAVVAPVTVRNYVVSHEWVLISTNGGINFYIGNNPDRDDTLAVRPGEHWRRLVRESLEAGARTRAEQSAYFFRWGLSYLRDQPLDFLRGLGVKAIRLMNAREIPRNVNPYVHRDFSQVLGILLWRVGPMAFPFSLLAPLAAAGVIVSLRTPGRPDSWHIARLLLLSFIVTYGASIVLFFVSSRYRLPMVVVMVVFAAAGGVWFWDRLRGGGPKLRNLAAGGGFVGAAVLVHLPIQVPTDHVNFRAELALCVGNAYATKGDLDKAESQLRRALDLAPRSAEAGAQLAGVLIRRGRWDEAERLLRNIVTWDREFLKAKILWASVLRRNEQSAKAAAVLDEALSRDPTSAEAHVALADLLMERGRTEEAVRHYRQAIPFAVEPGSLRIRLADALVQQGAYQEAIEQYRRALWRFEPAPADLNRIAWLLATCPKVELRDCKRAIELAEHLGRVTDYHHAVALDTLAAAYAECRRWTDAITWVKRAIELAESEGDSAAADSFRQRLRLYQQRLAGHDEKNPHRASRPAGGPP